MRLWLGVLWAVTAGWGAIDGDLPSPAPMVRGTFPHGAGRGATTEVELTGDNLQDATGVRFAGRGVEAKIVSRFGGKLKLAVTVAGDAEAGRRDYRLETPRGFYEGVFDIGALPEVREKEPNDDWRKAEPLMLPALVNGVLGSEDWDHFQIRAAAGETLVMDVSATRHGSRLDADVALLDAAGMELAWVDDTGIFGDPHLEYTFAKAGEYVVRVGSLAGGGDYRLTVGKLPYVRRALPAGIGAGRPTVVTLRGTHLDLVDRVWVGDGVAVGRILSKTAKELRVRLEAPAGTKPGRYWLHAAAGGREVPAAFEFRVSAFPEITATAEPLTRERAVAVTGSAVVNGAIETPKGMHFYKFSAAAGETFTFRSESMKLGYHLDPTLTVFDAEGKKLAFADDPGIDERSDEYQIDVDLSHRFEKAGTYFVGIRDGMYRGGEQLVYRLTVERMAPDFVVEVREPLKSLYPGQEDTLQVRVRRRAGWSSPVEVWAEGLPEGVSVSRQTAAPKDSVVKDTCGVDRTIDGTIVLLPVKVAAGAGAGSARLVVKARGVDRGRTVEHEAVVRYANAAAGYTYGVMEIAEARLTVTPAPHVLVTAPGSAGAGKMTVGLRRFGAAKQGELMVRAAGLPAGVTVEPVKAPAGAKQVELMVMGSGEGEMVVEVVSGGEVVGRAAPTAVKAEAGNRGSK